MVYKWSTTLFASVDANDAGREFSRIEKKHGNITSKILVAESRKKNAVLHNLFEWDNAVAGEKYREHQASQMICALISSPTEEEQENSTRRAYLNITESSNVATKGSFVSIESAMSDEKLREIVLNNALNDLLRFKERYRSLKEMAKVFEAIDYTQEELKAG